MRVHPSDSLSLQSGKSPLHRSSPAGSSRAGPLCKSHRAISERPVTPRVESIKPHSLSQPLTDAQPHFLMIETRSVQARSLQPAVANLVLVASRHARALASGLFVA